MKVTKRQTSTKTLADLLRALDRRTAVTVTFDKEEKDAAGKKTGRLVTDVRTVEPYNVHTTLEGQIVIKAMDRQSGESRTIRLDRIHAYTLHRSPFILDRPEATTPAGRVIVVRSTAQVIARELGRDYLPRTTVTRATTTLAA
jgi:predicted DNA-binding transcriptional regulator YafY